MNIDFGSYRNRLKKWNNSEKYQNEVEFLRILLEIKESDSLLDYGCGTGSCLNYLSKFCNNIDGYDVNLLWDEEFNPQLFINDLDDKKYNKIYFMHSIAHIFNIEEILIGIKNNLKSNGKIYVITPNKEFDEYFKKKNDNSYSPDLTVIKHYKIEQLVELFESSGYTVEYAGQFGKKESYFNERIFLIAKLDQ